MQDASEWQEILEVFYSFDANEVYPLPDVEGINETALQVGICARLYNAGFQTEATRLWERIVSDTQARNQQEYTRAIGNATENENCFRSTNTTDSHSREARTPSGSKSTRNAEAVHTSSGDKSKTKSVDEWLGDSICDDEPVKTQSKDSPIQSNPNTALHRSQQVQTLSGDSTISENSKEWLADEAVSSEQ